MDNKNSNIILCKDINLDREYINVLNYTEQEMLDLCEDKAVATANNYTFVRQDINEIKVNFSYNTCLQCNYMAFQNPNYSNKWFFAFIDEISYLSDNSTKIRFTVDEHSTWFDYWDAKTCLVLREHVADDTVGLHTYPEGLEHGDYVLNTYDKIRYSLQPQDYVIIATSWLPSNTPHLPSYQMYGGVFAGVYYLAFADKQYAKNFLLAIDGFGRADNIVSVFMAPAMLCNPAEYFEGQLNSFESLPNGDKQAKTYDVHAYFVQNNVGVQMLTDYTIARNTTLNGYQPVNNKLYCFPYNYLLISNNIGMNVSYNYEDFVNNTPIFDIYGCLCPGCSIKLYPKNYKLYQDTGILGAGFVDGIVGAKYPICSYTSDSYINWLTQQSVNETGAKINAGFTIAKMLAQDTGGDDSQYQSLINGQINYLSQRYQHALAGPQAMGNLNGGDVTFASDNMYFTYYKMSIRSEYARMIDDYFTRRGYQVNIMKIPNMISRTYWNYLQIGNQEEIGYSNIKGSVPTKSMDIINNIYRKGVTIWHDHANIGNYSLSNTIVQ